jgi:hypothetical protein
MKTALNLKEVFFNHYYKLQSQCGRVPLLKSLSRLSLSRQSLPLTFVSREVQDGRDACAALFNNTRGLVGNGLLVVGVFAIIFHQLFLNESPRDWAWFFINDYYFYSSIKLYVALVFWSIAFLLLSPAKWKIAYIPFSLVSSFAFLEIIHISFFIDSTQLAAIYHQYGFKSTQYQHEAKRLNDLFNTVPVWYVFVMAIALGFGFVKSFDYLLYRFHHVLRGNHTRFVGMAENKSLTPEQKESIFDTLSIEFRNQNARI